MSPVAIGFAIVAVLVVVGGVAWTLRPGRTPRDNRPPYILALGALADGDADTAFAQLKNTVRLDSGNIDAYLRLGELFRQRGEAERAFQIHRELTTRSSLATDDRVRVQHSMALDLIELGRLDKAEEAAHEAVRLAAEPLPFLRLQLDVMQRRGDDEGAFRTKKEILKREGRAKTGHAELAAFRAGQGRKQLDAGNLERAEKILKDAHKLDLAHAETAFQRGRLKERQGDFAGAIEAWNGILRDHPEKVVDLFRSLERVHFLAGSYSQIESTYTRFLERIPAHEDASFGLARFLRRKGHLDEAMNVCRGALDEHPNSRPLRNLYLVLLLEAGRAGEAESMLNDRISEFVGDEDGGEDGGEGRGDAKATGAGVSSSAVSPGPTA